MRRLALAVALVVPLACHSPRDPVREGYLQANMAGDVLAAGRWTGTLTGAPPQPALARMAEYAIEVRVVPVRDSALVRLTMEYLAPRRSPGTVDASRQSERASRRGRAVWQPIDVRVEDDVLAFRLYRVLGWEVVECRLRREVASGPLVGACNEVGERFRPLRLVLAVPPADSALARRQASGAGSSASSTIARPLVASRSASASAAARVSGSSTR